MGQSRHPLREANSAARDLSFEERLGLLVDREATEQENRRLTWRLRQARLRQNVAFEDLDWKTARGLNRAVLMELASCRWIREHRNLLIIGPTGVGRTFLACSLAHKACREGLSTLYQRTGRMLHELLVARGDGTYLRLIKSLAKPELLVIDDWGLESLGKEERHDLLELFEERHGQKSTIITSQMPIKNWHELIGEPTLADAILDRVVHNSHIINLEGDSMRKKMAASNKSKAGS
ncbi:MAG: IS21-like element helper ATPase IstB [Candidatus Ozemobacteraceae bacterium]